MPMLCEIARAVEGDRRGMVARGERIGLLDAARGGVDAVERRRNACGASVGAQRDAVPWFCVLENLED